MDVASVPPLSNAEVIQLPLLSERLPGQPDASLDPVLDATEACIARHGLAKTTLSDIARELRVAPSIVRAAGANTSRRTNRSDARARAGGEHARRTMGAWLTPGPPSRVGESQDR